MPSCFKVIIIMLYKENHVGYILILFFISKRSILTSFKLNWQNRNSRSDVKSMYWFQFRISWQKVVPMCCFDNGQLVKVLNVLSCMSFSEFLKLPLLFFCNVLVWFWFSKDEANLTVREISSNVQLRLNFPLTLCCLWSKSCLSILFFDSSWYTAFQLHFYL